MDDVWIGGGRCWIRGFVEGQPKQEHGHETGSAQGRTVDPRDVIEANGRRPATVGISL